MPEVKTIFTVIDPATDNQIALQRAMGIAQATKARIHAYLCISPTLSSHDPEALERVERARYQPWLDQIVENVRAEGVEIEGELDWSNNWRDSLGAAAVRAKSDILVKSTHRRSTTRRLLMTTSDQAVLGSAHCSVLLVSTDRPDSPKSVLVALDARRDDDSYRKLLNTMLEFGKATSEAYEGCQLHAVYAYSSQDEFAHRTDIARKIGIETDHVHTTVGDPEDVITEVAGNVKADVVIVGLSTRSTLANRIFGNIVDRLLNHMDHDILVVAPPED